jgi:hypothetical protein
MYHSLFSYLYETRLLFLKALNDEVVAVAGKHEYPDVDLNPITVNQLFHECIAEQVSFQEFGQQYAKNRLGAELADITD